MKCLLLLAFVGAAAADLAYPIWPPPRSLEVGGSPVALSDSFSIDGIESARLATAAERLLVGSDTMSERSAGASTGTAVLRIELNVASEDETLSVRTDYSYNLTLGADRVVRASAVSVYGAIYALETFTQMADFRTGQLKYESFNISDAPDHAWRGLMVDSGRRFVPMPVLQSLLDTMAAVKLNVLHLHASDMCRFGVESKLFPNLTDSLAGVLGGFYTQDDIAALLSYAADRGIRVVPEFDVPGHSRGFLPVESEGGLEFCTEDESRSQLHGTNGTYEVLHAVLGEMAGLFTDEVFNIGSDETSKKGKCDVNSTFELEREVLRSIANDFKKTPEGWEEVLFDAGAATNETIVNGWSHYTAADITAKGYKAVESKSSAFYFTAAVEGGPKGWAPAWYDITTGMPAAGPQRDLLLGGEMSMWTDTYCYITQCGGAGDQTSTPVGAPLFGPETDVEFGRSIGGMIWPRGFVGAAALWHFDPAADPTADDFVASVWATNDRLRERGAMTCATNCTCDQLTECGRPYLEEKSRHT